MLDVGWSEMLVIAIVMIVVVGPKDLPQMLRTFGRMMAKMRGMANDFQKQFNEALKEAELEDVKKSVDTLRSLNPAAEIRKQLNPFEKAAAEVRSGLDGMMKPKPAAETPAKAEAQAKVEAKLDEPAFPAMTDASASAPVAAPAEAKPAKPVRRGAAGTKAATPVAKKPVAAKAADKPVSKAEPAKKPAAAGKPAAARKPAAAAAAKAARSSGKPARALK